LRSGGLWFQVILEKKVHDISSQWKKSRHMTCACHLRYGIKPKMEDQGPGRPVKKQAFSK
jgi:hypothetical protein